MLDLFPETFEPQAPTSARLLASLGIPALILTSMEGDVVMNAACRTLLRSKAETAVGVMPSGSLCSIIHQLEADPIRASKLSATIRQTLALDSCGSTALIDCPTQSGRKRRINLVPLNNESSPAVLMTLAVEPLGNVDMMPDPELDALLRRALDQNEFFLAYQPKLSCVTGNIIGAEALIRWRHPSRGELSPGEFLPQLESSGLIKEVGAWALLTACTDFARIPAIEAEPSIIAVNVSGHQVKSPGLVELVRNVLAQSGLRPDRLELELTETVLMDRADHVETILRQLRDLGVRIAVDDFGTGYSSLSYLTRFPITTVKIDRSFINGIEDQPNSFSVVRAVLGMAKSLQLQSVAEGVETEGQLGILVANGCDAIQGYYFSPPVRLDVLKAMISDPVRLHSRLIDRESRRRTLLVVDDEDNVRHALRRALRRAPYTVLFAASGAEGLRVMAEQQVDVVLSDQRMPNMTGVEFLTRVKAIHPDTIRLVLSGFTDLSSVTDAINQGAIYKYLTKPWDDKLLLANLDEAFRQKDLIDENRRLLSNRSIQHEGISHAPAVVVVSMDPACRVIDVHDDPKRPVFTRPPQIGDSLHAYLGPAAIGAMPARRATATHTTLSGRDYLVFSLQVDPSRGPGGQALILQEYATDPAAVRATEDEPTGAGR